MIITRDCMPMVADVVSGAIPEPVALRPGSTGAEVLAWARETPAVRKLCATWNVTPDALKPVLQTGGLADLVDALGDPGAVVYLAGRLVALNSDGTRCAYDDAGLSGRG